MKWKSIIILVAMLLLALTSCSSNVSTLDDPSLSEEYVGPDFSINAVDIKTFEALCEWSNTIVKANYAGSEKFDSSTSIFMFDVETDFTGTVINEKTIHVYENSETSFVEGKSYYLFLSGYRSAGYPHVIYGRIEKNFLLGEEISSDGKVKNTFYEGYDLGVKDVKDFSKYIEDEIIQKKHYVTDPAGLLPESLDSACKNADVIVLATVTEVEEWNKYVSTCYYEVDKVLKGEYALEADQTKPLPDDTDDEYRDEVNKVAGTYTPNTMASSDTKIGDRLVLLFRYSDNKELIMYSGEHYQYPADSEAAKTILDIFK